MEITSVIRYVDSSVNLFTLHGYLASDVEIKLCIV